MCEYGSHSGYPHDLTGNRTGNTSGPGLSQVILADLENEMAIIALFQCGVGLIHVLLPQILPWQTMPLPSSIALDVQT